MVEEGSGVGCVVVQKPHTMHKSQVKMEKSRGLLELVNTASISRESIAPNSLHPGKAAEISDRNQGEMGERRKVFIERGETGHV
ncbi:MAG: hypothetical protein ACXQTL_01760 [Methanosarcinales archaeon]